MAPRNVAAALVNRHPDDVRRRCAPVACDVGTRAWLYDLDEVSQVLTTVPRRLRRVALTRARR